MKQKISLLFVCGLLALAFFFKSKLQPSLPLVTNQMQNNIPISLVPTLSISAPVQLSGLNSKNYILIDSATNQILVSNNQDEHIFPASTTKMATALTALNLYPLDEVVTVSSNYTNGKVIGLKVGEQITVANLLRALLIHSANDAAAALANHHQTGYSGFVSAANSLVKKINLRNTHFVNVDGVDNPDHYSSVYDLAQLARLIIQYPFVLETVKTQTYTIGSQDGKFQHELHTTNELLGKIPEIVGLKTGWTPQAGESFVGLINYHGRLFVSVVGNSTSRFSDTMVILNWLKSQTFI